MSGYECLNCAKIGDCQETSEEKARQQYYCAEWRVASMEAIEARNKALVIFGDSGLTSILSTKPKEQ